MSNDIKLNSLYIKYILCILNQIRDSKWNIWFFVLITAGPFDLDFFTYNLDFWFYWIVFFQVFREHLAAQVIFGMRKSLLVRVNILFSKLLVTLFLFVSSPTLYPPVSLSLKFTCAHKRAHRFALIFKISFVIKSGIVLIGTKTTYFTL